MRIKVDYSTNSYIENINILDNSISDKFVKNISNIRNEIGDDNIHQPRTSNNNESNDIEVSLLTDVDTKNVNSIINDNAATNEHSLPKQTYETDEAKLSEINEIGQCDLKLNVPRYKCDECGKHFNNRSYYQKHTEGHKSNNCTHCAAKFAIRKNLMNHMLHEHKIKDTAYLQCPHCDHRFVKRRNLYIHLAKNHAKGKHTCVECGKIFDSLKEYEEHSTIHKQFECPKCNENFSRKQQYEIHMKRHDKYECVTCNLTFASLKRILEHKKQGHDIKGLDPSLTCVYCRIIFSKPSAMKKHMTRHTVRISCSPCNRSFSNDRSYKLHLLSAAHEEKITSGGFICSICGAHFVKKAMLIQHLTRIHRQAHIQYKCKLCDCRFTTKTNLERHEEIHSRIEKEFICDQCGKICFNFDSLKRHQEFVHKEEAKFECNICGKKFKRNSELSRHLTSHSENRPFICSYCGQSYKRNTHLKRHIQIHTKSKEENNTRKKNTAPKKNKRKNVIEQQIIDNNLIEPIYHLPEENTTELVTLAISDVQDIVISKNLPSNFNLLDGQFASDLLQPLEIPFQELWSDKNLSPLPDDYINACQMQSLNDFNLKNDIGDNIQESFTICQIPDNILNQSAGIQLDHIDTADLIVLPSDINVDLSQVIQVQEGLSLPDYL